MSDMTFSDLGRVHWLSTLKVALARGFFAGLVWLVVTSLGPSATERSVLEMAMFPLMWMVLAVPLALFVQGVGWIGGMIIPAFGLFCTVLGSAIVCVGDPFVYILNRMVPQLLDIADFKIMNFQPMMFITHPE